MADLPTGTVSFLFTDIEGSTQLLHELGTAAYAGALADHRERLRAAFARHGGVEVDTQGDAFFVAFADASGAAAAAMEAQQLLVDGPIHVRMGIHSGSPQVTDDGYVGADVHLGARIAAAGHGGQVLLSKAAADDLGALELTDLGEHRVKDFGEPVWIYQLGSRMFPPLRTISNTNLPRPASTFVGREREVAEVTALITSGARLVTLTGPGGTGKTRLAIETAATHVPQFRNGVFWIPLAGLRDPKLVTGAIAQVVGAKANLAEHIGERQMLLLVDNLEQVIGAAADLAALVEACRNLCVVVTSRERLRVGGEVEYAVPPLAQPEAVTLFCARSGLDADDVITELCERLDNLPLAVELAAARASILTPEQIRDRLSGRLDLLRGGRDADPRQQTLRATIEWSYGLLSDADQKLFARLAVFSGGCMLEFAEDVAGADLDTLQSLVDKSLVRHSDDRFWMLETIREFALERLEASGEADALRTRHAERFLALAEEAEPELLGPNRDDQLDLLEREHDNLRSALDYLEASGEWQIALSLAGALAELWDQRGHHAEAVGRYERLLSSDRRPTPARAKALDGASMVVTKTGDMKTATEWGEEALDLYRRFGDKRGTAIMLWGLGFLSEESGDLVRAERMMSESVELLLGIGEVNLATWATRGLAYTVYRLGDLARARALYEDAIERAGATGDEPLQASLMATLPLVAIDQGDLDEAIALTGRSLRLLREVQDPIMVLSGVCTAARVLAVAGESSAATQLISHADVQNQQMQVRESWVETMNKRSLEIARSQLGDDAFEAAWEQGRDLVPSAALEVAIAAIDNAAERAHR